MRTKFQLLNSLTHRNTLFFAPPLKSEPSLQAVAQHQLANPRERQNNKGGTHRMWASETVQLRQKIHRSRSHQKTAQLLSNHIRKITMGTTCSIYLLLNALSRHRNCTCSHSTPGLPLVIKHANKEHQYVPRASCCRITIRNSTTTTKKPLRRSKAAGFRCEPALWISNITGRRKMSFKATDFYVTG